MPSLKPYPPLNPKTQCRQAKPAGCPSVRRGAGRPARHAWRDPPGPARHARHMTSLDLRATHGVTPLDLSATSPALRGGAHGAAAGQGGGGGAKPPSRPGWFRSLGIHRGRCSHPATASYRYPAAACYSHQAAVCYSHPATACRGQATCEWALQVRALLLTRLPGNTLEQRTGGRARHKAACPQLQEERELKMSAAGGAG